MLKFLDIDLYDTDGYHVTSSDCIALPIAYGAGYYNRPNYFFYLFYKSIFRNWNLTQLDEDNGFVLFQNSILNRIGIFIDPVIFENNDLINPIKSNIDNKNPLLLLVSYKYLFYDMGSYSITDGPHGILVTGYDSDRSLIISRDWAHVNNFSAPITPMHILSLSEEIFLDLWTKSNIYFNEGGTQNIHTLYVIKENNYRPVNNFYELFRDFYSDFKIENNRLFSVISDFEKYVAISKNFPPYFRNHFYLSLKIFFDVISKILSSSSDKNEELYQHFEATKNRYMRHRDLITAKLSNLALKKHTVIDPITKNKLFDQIHLYDNELYNLLSAVNLRIK